MGRLQAVIFDLDDTLYPEREFVLSGFRAVAIWAEKSLGMGADQAYKELAGLFELGVRGDTFDRWIQSHGYRDVALVNRMVNVYREHEPTISPFPEVIGVLIALKRRYRLGLVSDGHHGVQRRKLGAVGLTDYFDGAVFSDEIGRDAWKPSTKPFEAILNLLAVPSSQSVYIADNPLKDFFGANRLGLRTIWVRRYGCEYTRREPPSPSHDAELRLETLEGLEEALETLSTENTDAPSP